MAEILNDPATPEKYGLTPKRIELMHRAMDGRIELRGVMHVLNGYKFCDNFLIWLIAHGFTGKTLEEIVVKRFRSSIPAMVEWMVLNMNRSDVTEVKGGGQPG